MSRQLSISDYGGGVDPHTHLPKTVKRLQKNTIVLRKSTSKRDGLKAIASAFGAVTIEQRIDKPIPDIDDLDHEISIKQSIMDGHDWSDFLEN